MIVDLFAGGPAGWDLAAPAVGLDAPLGFEFDPDACRTRDLLGLATYTVPDPQLALFDPRGLPVDLSEVDPHEVDDVDGLIGSPPCQSFSTAGKRQGLDDPRGRLVWVPCDWAEAHRPRWVALEQVPPVLPIWEVEAERLRDLGYATWTGVLSAEQYGVPQTRKRAILIARLDRQPAEPPPTNQPYRKGVPQGDPEATDGGRLAPWVSMGEALVRAGIWAVDADGEVNTGRDWKPGGDRSIAQRIASTEPAPTFTVTSGHQWQLGFPRRDDRGDSPDGYRTRDFRGADEPGFVVTEKARSFEWRLAERAKRGDLREMRANAVERSADEPAQTLLANAGKSNNWWWERPATTVACDSRLWPPGHKVNADDRDRLGAEEADARYGDRAGTEARRLTIPEALVIQGFPADLPLYGTRTSRFRQIGNAIPPALAAAVLKEASS